MGYRDELYEAIGKAEADGWSVDDDDNGNPRATRYGWTVNLGYDECPESPREWDNLGVMVCFHGRYNLGDKGHGYRAEDYESWAELAAKLAEDYPGSPVLPLGLYDHGGITMYVGGGPHAFDSAGWDSGTVGLIVARLTDGREDATPEEIEEWLRGEVEEYDAYLTGNVYRYDVTDPDGERVEACCGFYGDDGLAYAFAEGIGIAEGCIADERAELAATEAALDDVRDVAAGLALVAKRDALRITAGVSA